MPVPAAGEQGGQVRRGRGSVSKARPTCTPADDPAHDRALAAAGNMWIAAGQPGQGRDGARTRRLRARACWPSSMAWPWSTVPARPRLQGDLKTARAKVSEAAKTIGEDPYLWYLLRRARHSRRRYSDRQILDQPGARHGARFSGSDVRGRPCLSRPRARIAKAREYWTKAVAADPNGPTGKAAREALAMTDAPLTVTNQVATRPEGDGEGSDKTH